MRNNDTYAYRIDNLKELSELLSHVMWGNSNVMLLQADIYKNMFKEFRKAEEIYEKLQKKVAWGSVYYNLGRISEEYDNDYMKAINYYQQSTDFLAERYLSFYHIAQCWRKMGEPMKSVAAYREVIETIKAKMEHHMWSLVQIEYMFESAVSLGNIWSENKNGYENAEASYELAEVIYDIMDNEFLLECMLRKEYPIKVLRRVAKKNHDKTELLQKLYFTNILLGKSDDAKKYQNKMRKEEENYEET